MPRTGSRVCHPQARPGGGAFGRVVTIALAALLVAAPAAGGEAVVGYRGDGTGVFPGANPPTTWDDKTTSTGSAQAGSNILWKVPMPNWGHSTPVPVAGRVFVTVEPGWKCDFPVLLCLDADTGRTLWRRELNHLPATGLTAADAAAAAETWHDLLAKYRLAYTIFNEYIYGDREAGKRKFEANGFTYRGWRGGGYGQLRSMRFTDARAHRERLKEIARAGLTLETWQHHCGMGTHCIGQTFATPVSDGRHVYVATSFNAFFCFDLDGRPRWVRYVPGATGEYCRNARSPLLYKDLLISDICNKVRAFDKATGALRWSDDSQAAKGKGGAHGILTPVVLTVGGPAGAGPRTDVLWCAGPNAYRLPDGRKLTVVGWDAAGTRAVLNYDEPDVVFLTGGGEHGDWPGKGGGANPPPAALKFSLQGSNLVAKVLWCGIDGKPVRRHTGIVYHDGRLYHPNGFIADAASGKVLKGSADRRSRSRATPNTRHLLLIAGGHVYGLNQPGGKEGKPGQTGICEVYTLDGRKVAANVMHNAPVEGEKKRQIVETYGWATWPFSYSCPFTIAGSRIYIRSNDYLWCVGR